MSTKEGKIEDLLRIEGVKSKGYGTVPKAAMTDRDISIAAKAIYAYFCSLSGRGETVFPGRSKILLDLQISKEAYYKGLKELTDAGYIRVTQEHNSSSGGRFMRNIYTLVARPAKYRKVPEGNPAKALAYQEIIISGIDSQGYGYIPYAVMSDPRMRFQPKATYGYLSAHIGPNNTADLDAGIIAYHLGVSTQDTVQRYMKQLKGLNYVTITRLLENGRYTGKNRYCLIQAPDFTQSQKRMIYENTPVPLSIVSAPEGNNEHSLTPNAEKQDTAAPDPEKQDTVVPNPEKQDTVAPNLEKRDTVAPNPEKQDTVAPNLEKRDTVAPNLENQDTAGPNAVFQDTEKQDTEKQDTEKQDTGNQDTINTSPTNTSSTITSLTNTSIMMDRLISRVREMINYQILVIAYGHSDIELYALDLLVLTIAEVLGSSAPRIMIAKQPMFTTHIRETLLELNSDIVCSVLERFLVRIEKIDREKHKQYLLTSVYHEIKCPTVANDGCEEQAYSMPI